MGCNDVQRHIAHQKPVKKPAKKPVEKPIISLESAAKPRWLGRAALR